MTERTDEIKKCLALVQASYPSFMTDRDMDITIMLWMKAFSEPYEVIEAAIMAFIVSETTDFPNIGRIKEKIAEKTEEVSELQAWSIVNRALCRASRREYAKLSPLIQQCIGAYDTFMEWSYMDEKTVNVTIANAFMRTYKVKAAHQRDFNKLPSSMRSEYPKLPDQQQYALPQPEAQPLYNDPTSPPQEVIEQVSKLKSELPEATTTTGKTAKERAAELTEVLLASMKGKNDVQANVQAKK